MFKKTILIFLSLFSFSYAVDEIDIEKRRQEQQDFDNEQFIGNTTESCMLSGVYNNVVREIEGIITQYEEKFANLAVILTGGNQKYLQERIKKPIFASSFVLLEGLNSILEYQKEMQHSINGQFKQYDE